MSPLKRDTNMRTAFIRISAVNVVKVDNQKLDVHAGDIIKYSIDDIKLILDEWQKTKDFEYYIIEHNEDEENCHIHVVLVFRNSMAKFSTIKAKFPYGQIKTCKNVRACVRYLCHADDSDKRQYSFDEVITNAPEKLEDYKKTYKEKETEKIKNIIDDILSGKIREYQRTEIDNYLLLKYKKKINDAFEIQRERIIKNPNRNIKVYVLQGSAGAGKSTFCKAWAKMHNKSICFSSSSNDPWQDYKGQDIFVIDDFNSSKISLQDMVKVLDPFVNTTVSSRYHNKVFIGDTIFICTNSDILFWYSADSKELQKAFYRRIKYVMCFEPMKPDFIAHYTVKKLVLRDSVEYEQYEKERQEYVYYGEDFYYEECEPEPYYLMRNPGKLIFVKEKDLDLKPYMEFDNSPESQDTFLEDLDKM